MTEENVQEKPKKRPRKVYLRAQDLKQARRWVGLSQAALGRKVGVLQQQVAAWEAEPRPAELEQYYKRRKESGMRQMVAELLKRVLLEHAQAQGLDLEPLEKLFSPE